MLVKKIITIKLTEDEVKEALLNYVSASLPWSYVKHIRDNEFLVDFADGEFILCIDGEMDDDVRIKLGQLDRPPKKGSAV